RIARALDGDVERPRVRGVPPAGRDAAARQEGELRVMTPDHEQCAAGEREGLRDELAQLAVAHDEDAVARADRDLLLDLEGRGERLGEHGGIGGYDIGAEVEVLRGEGEGLGQ